MSMSMVEVAQKAIQDPKVQNMMKELSQYGLGICMPHMHDPESNEEFSPLPKGIVSLERELQVTFVNESETADAVPVAWMWDKESASTTVVGACGRGGHTVPAVKVVGACGRGGHTVPAVKVVGACGRGGHI